MIPYKTLPARRSTSVWIPSATAKRNIRPRFPPTLPPETKQSPLPWFPPFCYHDRLNFNRSVPVHLSNKRRHVPHATSLLGVVHFTTATPRLNMGFDFRQRISALFHSFHDSFPRPVKTVTNGDIHVRILLQDGNFHVSCGKGQRTVQ